MDTGDRVRKLAELIGVPADIAEKAAEIASRVPPERHVVSELLAYVFVAAVASAVSIRRYISDARRVFGRSAVSKALARASELSRALGIRQAPIEEYARRAAEAAGAPHLAERIASRASELYRVALAEAQGKSRAGLAAAAVYIAASELGARITLKALSKLFGVSEPNIRAKVRLIRRLLTPVQHAARG